MEIYDMNKKGDIERWFKEMEGHFKAEDFFNKEIGRTEAFDGFVQLKNKLLRTKNTIIDPANVMMVSAIREENNEIIILEDFDHGCPNGKFKLVGPSDEQLQPDCINAVKYKTKKTGTIIGKEYYDRACTILGALGKPTLLYEKWDDNKNDFVKDHPIVLGGDGVAIVIAPRIDRD